MIDPKDYMAIDSLLKVMAQLRNPNGGCPWDLEQDFSTIAPYTLEEAYEVADAIERNDMADLCEELGDLLLQVVFHAQIASEEDHFDFGHVVSGTGVVGPTTLGTATDSRCPPRSANLRPWQEAVVAPLHMAVEKKRPAQSRRF